MKLAPKNDKNFFKYFGNITMKPQQAAESAITVVAATL
jgi:hypothetical protein